MAVNDVFAYREITGSEFQQMLLWSHTSVSAGMVLRATGPTTYAFQVFQALNIGNGLVFADATTSYDGVTARTLRIDSHAGTAGFIGTLAVGATTIGVNLGTTSITAAAGNHAHGNITNDGKIGIADNLVVVTGINGVLATASRDSIDSRQYFPPAGHPLNMHSSCTLTQLNAIISDATLDSNTAARPASDVYSWAKAATKPAYTASEVGALASTHAASGVTSQKITNWDTAHGWGNHAGLYLAAATVLAQTKALVTNEFFTAYNASTGAFSSARPTWTNVDGKPTVFTPESHALTSHTVSGLTTGHFLKATGATTFGFVAHGLTKTDVGLGSVENTALSTWVGSANITTIGTLSAGTVPWARLSNVPSTFTPTSHTLLGHTVSGLTTGHFLKATGATTFGFTAHGLTKTDIGLSAVENTAISTWAGSANITTIGTLSSGSVPWARLINVPVTFSPAAHALNAHSACTISQLNAIISDGTLMTESNLPIKATDDLLTAHWTFDDALPTMARENMGRTKDSATLDLEESTSGTSIIRSGGVTGTCAYFYGTTFSSGRFYKTPGSVTLFNSNTSYTVSFWVKVTQYGGTIRLFFSKNAWNATGFKLGMNTSGQLILYSTTSPTTLNHTFSTNVWTHVAVTYNGSGTFNAYINGILVHANIPKSYSDTSAGVFYIGSANGTYQYIGSIDDFRIYSGVLNIREIQGIYYSAAMSGNTMSARVLYLGEGTEISSSHYVLNVKGYANVTQTIRAADFVLSSDERLKTNIIGIKKKTNDICYKQFNFKGKDRLRYGVIAQDIEKEYPELIAEDDKGMKTVSYLDLHSLEISNLKREIAELKQQLKLS